MYHEFYIQIPRHSSLASQNLGLAPRNSECNLPQSPRMDYGIADCFPSLYFVVSLSLPCEELWFSCRKTSGYLGKCVGGGGFVPLAMPSTAAGASADTELLQPLSTGHEKLNLTPWWRDNLCHFNSLILHRSHCRDWDERFHGAEQHYACLSEMGNKTLFSLLGKSHYVAVADDPLGYRLRSH